MASDEKKIDRLRTTLQAGLSVDSLTLLMIQAKFGYPLDSPDEVAVHNDRMVLIQKLVGPDKLFEWVQRIAQISLGKKSEPKVTLFGRIRRILLGRGHR